MALSFRSLSASAWRQLSSKAAATSKGRFGIKAVKSDPASAHDQIMVLIAAGNGHRLGNDTLEGMAAMG